MTLVVWRLAELCFVGLRLVFWLLFYVNSVVIVLFVWFSRCFVVMVIVICGLGVLLLMFDACYLVWLWVVVAGVWCCGCFDLAAAWICVFGCLRFGFAYAFSIGICFLM